MLSYSHTQEDMAVVDIFGTNYHGYFLDIGATDGEWLSNTLALEEQFGWTGICVEADEGYFGNLKSRRKCNCFNYAVGSRDGGNNITLKTLFGTVTPIPTIIDYFSLDVDGGEVEILKGFPWDTCKLRFAQVEHDVCDGQHDEHKQAIYALMRDRGFIRVVDNHGHPGHPYEDWYALPEVNADWEEINRKYKIGTEYRNGDPKR